MCSDVGAIISLVAHFAVGAAKSLITAAPGGAAASR